MQLKHAEIYANKYAINVLYNMQTMHFNIQKYMQINLHSICQIICIICNLHQAENMQINTQYNMQYNMHNMQFSIICRIYQTICNIICRICKSICIVCIFLICKEICKNMQNMQAICRFGPTCHNLPVICKICKNIQT